MSHVRPGDIAPDFASEPTYGSIQFHDWMANAGRDCSRSPSPEDRPLMGRRTFLGGLALAGAALGLGAHRFARAQSAAASWDDDVATWAARWSTRHVDPYRHLDLGSFDADVAALRSHLGQTDDARRASEWARILARIGDSHSRVDLPELTTPRLPVAVSLYAEGLFIVAATQEHLDLVGHRLVSVGGLSITSLAAELAALVPARIPSEVESRVEDLIVAVPLLAELARSLGQVLPATILLGTQPFANGRMPPAHRATYTTIAPVLGPQPTLTTEVELGLRRLLPFEESPHRRYFVRQMSDRAYLRYRSCTPDPSYPVARLADDLRAILRDTALTGVILDVRGNPGGDSSVLTPVAEVLAGPPPLGFLGHAFEGI